MEIGAKRHVDNEMYVAKQKALLARDGTLFPMHTHPYPFKYPLIIMPISIPIYRMDQ